MAKINTDSPKPTFKIKQLHERKTGGPIRKHEGMSGLRYIFRWDTDVKAYTYEPKNEDEVRDLFETVGKVTGAAFAPVSVELTEKPEPTEPAGNALFVAPDVTAIEECIVRGIIITEEDDAAAVRRLLDSYNKGYNRAKEIAEKEAAQSPEPAAKPAAPKKIKAKPTPETS